MRRSLFYRWRILRFVVASIRFNFHYLPFRQAIKLPIVFMAPSRCYSMRGSVKIEGPIRHAMISFGLPGNDVFDRDVPFIWNAQGGECVFHGAFAINPGSSITLRERARLIFGRQVSFGQHTRIVCCKSIDIGDNALFSWETLLMDSDHHPFFDLRNNVALAMQGGIVIGDRTFVGARCTILKDSLLPNDSSLSSNSLLNRKMAAEFTVYGGIPARPLKSDIARIIDEKNISEGIRTLKKRYAQR